MCATHLRFLLFMVCLVFIFSTQAQAQDSVSTTQAQSSTSVTEVETNTAESKSLADHFSVNYQNVFFGPPVDHPIKSVRPDRESETGEGTLNMENTLFAGYRINENISVGPVMVWHWHPVTDHSFELSNPYAKIGHAKLFNSGDFSLSADFRISAPLSDQSRKLGLVTSIASEQVSSFEVGRSGFILSLTSFFQRNFHKQGSVEVDDFEFQLKPAASYRVLSNLLANVVFEKKVAHTRDQDLIQMHNKGNVIQPGVIWDITKTVNFNPYLDINIDQQITAASTTIGASLNWQLL